MDDKNLTILANALAKELTIVMEITVSGSLQYVYKLRKNPHKSEWVLSIHFLIINRANLIGNTLNLN